MSKYVVNVVNSVNDALPKLKMMLSKEGVFMLIKAKSAFADSATKRKYKEKQAYNRRMKEKRAKFNTVKNDN